MELRPCLEKFKKMRICRSLMTRNCYVKDVFKARSRYAKDVFKTSWRPKIVCWTLLCMKGVKMGLCLKLKLHLNWLIPNWYIVLIDIGILVQGLFFWLQVQFASDVTPFVTEQL